AGRAGRAAHCGTDSRFQHVRCLMTHEALPSRAAHVDDQRELSRAVDAVFYMSAKLALLFGRQLVVDECVDHRQAVGAAHRHPASLTPAPSATASRRRARARRDITVPIGTPTTSLISRYDKSCTSRSTITSRNSGGSADTARSSSARSDR